MSLKEEHLQVCFVWISTQMCLTEFNISGLYLPQVDEVHKGFLTSNCALSIYWELWERWGYWSEILWTKLLEKSGKCIYKLSINVDRNILKCWWSMSWPRSSLRQLMFERSQVFIQWQRIPNWNTSMSLFAALSNSIECKHCYDSNYCCSRWKSQNLIC